MKQQEIRVPGYILIKTKVFNKKINVFTNLMYAIHMFCATLHV